MIRYKPKNPCPVCGTGTKGCNSFDGSTWFNCRGADANSFTPNHVWHKETASGFHSFQSVDSYQEFLGKGSSRPSIPAASATPPPRISTSTPKDQKQTGPTGPTEFDDVLARRRPFGIFEDDYFISELGGVSMEAVNALGVQIHIPEDRSGQRPAMPAGMYPWGTKVRWAFPQVDSDLNIVGFSLRLQYKIKVGGQLTNKISAKGGHQGFFVLRGIDPHKFDTIYIVEGGSDVLAMFTLGLYAIGRSSNVGGIKEIAEFLRKNNLTNKQIVIVGENDAHVAENGAWVTPGADGIKKTQSEFAAVGIVSFGAYPPENYKDTRDFMIDRGADENGLLVSDSDRGQWLESFFKSQATVCQVFDPASIAIASPAPLLEATMQKIWPIDRQYRACNVRPRGDEAGRPAKKEEKCPNAHRIGVFGPIIILSCECQDRGDGIDRRFLKDSKVKCKKCGRHRKCVPNDMDDHHFTDMPCGKNTCEVCGPKNIRYKCGIIKYRIQGHQWAAENAGDEPKFYVYDLVANAINWKKRIYEDIRDGEHFKLRIPTSFDLQEKFRVCSTVPPSSCMDIVSNYREVTGPEAIEIMTDTVKSWELQKRGNWITSSRGWKDPASEKKNELPNSEFICSVRSKEALYEILDGHGIDIDEKTHSMQRGAFKVSIQYFHLPKHKKFDVISDLMFGEFIPKVNIIWATSTPKPESASSFFKLIPSTSNITEATPSSSFC
jgi:hypothetical protein